jgi:hypothetical protein
VEPEETSIARQGLSKHLFATTLNNENIIGNRFLMGHNEEPRPAELMTEEPRERFEGGQFSCGKSVRQ